MPFAVSALLKFAFALSLLPPPPPLLWHIAEILGMSPTTTVHQGNSAKPMGRVVIGSESGATVSRTDQT